MANVSKLDVKVNPEEIGKRLVALMKQARSKGHIETKTSSKSITLTIHVARDSDVNMFGSVAAMINQHMV